MKANCNRCGVQLDKIRYLEPDWGGHYDGLAERRPPLCKPCWQKADAAAVKLHGRRPS